MFLKEGIDKKAFAAGEKALKSYAIKNGGVDKADFMDVSKMLGQISRVNILQAGQLITTLNRKVSGMDHDARDHAKKDGKDYDGDVSVQHKYDAYHMKKRGYTHFEPGSYGTRRYTKGSTGYNSTKITSDHHSGVSE